MLPKIRFRLGQSQRFRAWLLGTLVAPVTAFPFIKDARPDFEFDFPTVTILLLAWGVISFLLWLFIKEKFPPE